MTEIPKQPGSASAWRFLTWGAAMVLTANGAGPALAQGDRPVDVLRQSEQERTNQYAATLEDYLRKWLVDAYPQRAANAWNRDYRSVEAFLKNVEPNRQRWRKVIKPPALTQLGELQRSPHTPLADLEGEWLTEFTDSDVVSLICPRPLLIQTGKKDRTAHWPQVVDEFAAARVHYEKLGLAERIEMDLHKEGHEPRVQSGVRFLSRWLMDESLPTR